MKKVSAIFLAICAVLFSSCHKDIWDKLNDHERRIAQLETLCNQYNTTIESLQQLIAALQAENKIKDISPVMENGKTVGYTISFTSGNPITIYNGKNGQDGHTPIVGVKQDTDGFWYWTIDDNWMLNGKGEKVRADAAQGITPKLKIEDEYWWVSYDEGESWSKLGKAVTDGADDSMFSEIRQDEKYVYFVLTNGQTISIPKSQGLTFVYVNP
ncbi:MAG: hypothetical protein IKR69_02520 [Bacteroidales bacterium]|nr:hypothetical protein [Bacteroidales bacterium]